MIRRLWPALLAAAGCVAPPPPAGPAAPRVLAWRLVEADGALVFEPDGRDAGPLEIRYSRERAEVGEFVEARIRLPGARGRHLLEVVPDRPDVRIEGARRFVVEGGEAARVRFTCAVAGRGGLRVLVTEVSR